MWGGVPTIISVGWRVIRYVSFWIQLNVYFLQTKEPWHLQWDIEHGERFFIQGFANPCLNLSAAALMAAEASNPELHVRGLIMLHSHSFSSRLTSRRIVANWNRFSKRVDQGMDINSEKWPKKRDSTFKIVFFCFQSTSIRFRCVSPDLIEKRSCLETFLSWTTPLPVSPSFTSFAVP